jgi:hypothetical protein
MQQGTDVDLQENSHSAEARSFFFFKEDVEDKADDSYRLTRT